MSRCCIDVINSNDIISHFSLRKDLVAGATGNYLEMLLVNAAFITILVIVREDKKDVESAR